MPNPQAPGLLKQAPRVNAAQRRVNNQAAQMPPQRVNAAERRMQNQGQAPQQMPPQQRPPMPPQMGGGSQISGAPMQRPQPVPRPTGQGQFQTPPGFQPGQMPWGGGGFGQGFNPQNMPQWGGQANGQFGGQPMMPYQGGGQAFSPPGYQGQQNPFSQQMGQAAGQMMGNYNMGKFGGGYF